VTMRIEPPDSPAQPRQTGDAHTSPHVATPGLHTPAGQGNPNDSAAAQSADSRATSAHPGPVAAAALLAIDPGNTESAYAVIDHATRQPLDFGKVLNHELLDRLDSYDFAAGERTIDHVAIEMVASYGMPVGADVFETCVWIGRYQQAFYTHGEPGFPVELVKRHPVKLHHCHTSKAKDSNITQALVDRFTPGQPNRGKGTKSEPGWFYGFAADVWQAYALAVYVADTTPITASAMGPSPVTVADAATTPPRLEGEASRGGHTIQEALL
jgi:hypothetical protein